MTHYTFDVVTASSEVAENMPDFVKKVKHVDAGNTFRDWLRFLIEEYENLSDFILFVNHDVKAQTPFASERDFTRCLREKPWVFMDKTKWTTVLTCDEKGLPHHPNLPIKEAFLKYFPELKCPPLFEFTMGGNILLPKRRVLNHPKSFYEMLSKDLERHEIAPFTLERLWNYI